MNTAQTKIRSSRYIGLALVAGSLLFLEVTFTRIFSIMIWYHFAYLIIGIALLGGGAAGTYLAVWQWDVKTISRRIGKLALLLSLSILLSLLIINIIQFDPLDSQSSMLLNLFGLASYFGAIFLIYFLGGLVVAGIFRCWGEDVHQLYFADLIGAGISALIALWLIQKLTGPGSLVLAALMILVASLIFWTKENGLNKNMLWVIFALELVLFINISAINPINLPVPNSKELGRLMSMVGVEKPEQTFWNPVARIDVLPVFESQTPWIIGGISSSYHFPENVTYQQRFVTLDGTSMTVLFQYDGDRSRFDFLDHTIISAPYKVAPSKPKVLNIGVGGGLDIILAKKYNARHITAVELNSDIVNLVENTYSEFVGNLAQSPDTRIVVAEGRSFLLQTNETYDIIQGIGLDNFAALNGGAYVLSESYLYTVDSVELALSKLTPNGVFAWTRTVYTPPREMLRLTGIAAEALRNMGIANPALHIAVIANEDGKYATMMVSAQPFRENVINEFRQWVEDNHFIWLHDPLLTLDTPFAEYLLTDFPRAYEQDYPFNIFPVTDENPFFYNYFKWTNLVFIFNDEGDVNLRFPLGNIVILVMLGFSGIAAGFFIIYPLLRYERRGLKIPYALQMLIYFSLLGVGYIMVEIVLIQRFTLFIGYPSQAIATTIFGLLVFSAIGSLVGKRFVTSNRSLQYALLLVVLMLILYNLGLPSLLRILLAATEETRIFLSIIFLAPVGLAMGIPFPTGLYQLGLRAQVLIPWAWGVNGVFSVLGSVLVILLSMQFNFTTTFYVAALFYLLACLVSPYLWKTDIVFTQRRTG